MAKALYGDKARVVFYTDPETARRLRVLAALKETSVSSYVNGEVVKPHVDNYQMTARLIIEQEENNDGRFD
jgi:hypothetical protein